MKKARLILDNGMVFEGTSIGADNTLFCELVFNTSMTGYQEILTDPSYASQAIVMTYPEIGNTGINTFDFESQKIYARGLIVKNYCYNESHYLSNMTLRDFLIQNDVVGISGIDTRALTRILRSSGTVNCVVTTEQVTDKLLEELERYKLSKDIVLMTTRKHVEHIEPSRFVCHPVKLAVIDYGIKSNILRELARLGCDLTVFPADVTAEEILNGDFDSVFLSNGPGDPANCSYQIEVIKKLVDKLPIFGICLGYQLLSIVLGAKTYKLKYGHRGGNHPVIDLRNGKVMLTSQNHGYAVDTESLNENITPTYKNLNDNTLEGFCCEKSRIYAVQFHPEAAPGPVDANIIFDEWYKKMISFKKSTNTKKEVTNTTILTEVSNTK